MMHGQTNIKPGIYIAIYCYVSLLGNVFTKDVRSDCS